METWHIHIAGQVQGVGFRPFVYRLARQHQLKGWVNNTSDGVHIEVNGSEKDARQFYQSILKQAPSLAQITQHRIFQAEKKFFEDFRIIHSKQEEKVNLLLTPDFALCRQCQAELFDRNNRRMGYPFTTCTLCGPRYSIIRELPYDRPTTTMNAFKMCPACQTEYDDPLDRRYFSQTNSCPACSIPLRLLDAEKRVLSQNMTDITRLINRAWREGRIVAIKGIGGYLLTCPARDEAAVRRLRQLKHRPNKPFALMYPGLNQLRQDALLRETEQTALESVAAPIVLLEAKDNNSLAKSIAPGLSQLGVMLPYAPLFEWLLQAYQAPVVATSGNISDSPIVFRDERAQKELTQLADLILINDRRIVIPQDDSVVRYTPVNQQRILIRRSRGLAPTYIDPELNWPDQSILASGAMLKSTFTFLHRGNTYISQYLGDLSDFETDRAFRHTVRHFFQTFKTLPQLILADRHPGYPSSLFAEQIAREHQLPLKKIQHHMAHFGAVLGENRLLDMEQAILGVIWDGTGLGDDGNIWGGEFFVYEKRQFSRALHFDYFDFILGDKMPREPRISALSACKDVEGGEEILRQKFTRTEWSIYDQMLSKESRLQTSSLGRIFDAVASLLGLMDKQTFEGEAAMLLENQAFSYFQKNGWTMSGSYFHEGDPFYRIPTKLLMSSIIMDLKKKKDKEFIAAKFHFSLITLIKIVADHLNIKKIAFSGGVFQNCVLVDLILIHLEKEYELFFHHQLSPNDENVSFGQLICYMINDTQNPK